MDNQCFRIAAILLLSAGSLHGVAVFPPLNYTVFESSSSSPFTFNCTGAGNFLFWMVDGYDSTSAKISQRGINTISLSPNGSHVFSRLTIPTTEVNNNTEVVCKVFDYMLTNVQYSPRLYLILQGSLSSPYAFDVVVIDTTFTLSWGAPFSLDVTDYVTDIFYYVLCINVTAYGCMAIPNDPDCTFPKRCNYSFDYTQSQISKMNKTGPSLLETDAIVLSLRAVNGAGNGTAYSITYKAVTNEMVDSAMSFSSNMFSLAVCDITPTYIMTAINTSTIMNTSMNGYISLNIPLTIIGALSGAAAVVCLILTGAITYICGHSRRGTQGQAREKASKADHLSCHTIANSSIDNMDLYPTYDVALGNLQQCPAYGVIHVTNLQ